jgi:chromosome segregation ATPase
MSTDTPTQRRQPVSREAVFATAQAITNEGETLTMAAIRERIGGSFTTIGPLLKEWKRHAAQTSAQPELPKPVLEVMRQATASIWETANQLAREQVVQLQTAAQETVASAQHEAQEYAAEIQRLEDQLEHTRNELKTTIQTKERVFLDKAHLERENATLAAQLTAKETALATLEARLDRLQGELVAIAKGNVTEHKR